MRRVRRLLADTPLAHPHPLQDRLGKEKGEAPIELRHQVSAQHLFGGPGNRPFGALRVGHGVWVGHAKRLNRSGTDRKRPWVATTSRLSLCATPKAERTT